VVPGATYRVRIEDWPMTGRVVWELDLDSDGKVDDGGVADGTPVLR